jgi:hypothetical protein
MKRPHAVVLCDSKDMYVICDGVKIAKRGHPGTRYARTWISLEPGWTVRDCDNGESMEISYSPDRRTVQ